MRVKCLYNTGKYTPKDFFVQHNWTEEMKFIELTIGKEYTVYAVFILFNHPCYLICDDFYDGVSYAHPMFYPASLFEVIDNTPSRYWIQRRIKHGIEHNMNDVGFPDILNDEYFYGGVVEGYQKEVQVFQQWKCLIDREFERGNNKNNRDEEHDPAHPCSRAIASRVEQNN